jgi:predicted cobalt transporter CbtA
MRDMQAAFLVTEAAVNRFQTLMVVVLSSGALAGLALFLVQHFSVVPLINVAETYEAAAHRTLSSTVHEDKDQQARSWGTHLFDRPRDDPRRHSFCGNLIRVIGLG